MTDQKDLEQAVVEVQEVHRHLQDLAGRVAEYGTASKNMKEMADALSGVAKVLKDTHDAMSSFIQQTGQLKQKSQEIQNVQSGILEEIPVLLRHLQTSGIPKSLDDFRQQVKSLSEQVGQHAKSAGEIGKGISKLDPRMDRLEATIVEQIKAVGKRSAEQVETTLSKSIKASEQDLHLGLGTIVKSSETSKDLLMEILKTLGSIRHDLKDVKSQGLENAGKIHILSRRRGIIW